MVWAIFCARTGRVGALWCLREKLFPDKQIQKLFFLE